jgi:hypothetical protein
MLKRKFGSARRDFLLTFFDAPYKYEHKNERGFILQTYFDTSNQRWGVMVYTPEGFAKAEDWKQKQHLNQDVLL